MHWINYLIIGIVLTALYLLYLFIVKPELTEYTVKEQNSKAWNDHTIARYLLAEEGGDPDSIPEPTCPSPWEGG